MEIMEEMGRIHSMHEEMRNACRILVGKSEENRSLWRPKHRCEGDTKMFCKEIGFDEWVWPAHDRVQ
jgi:hypothetical protein